MIIGSGVGGGGLLPRFGAEVFDKICDISDFREHVFFCRYTVQELPTKHNEAAGPPKKNTHWKLFVPKNNAKFEYGHTYGWVEGEPNPLRRLWDFKQATTKFSL